MMTRKSIDTILLSVGADKLSQREWDWMKMLKPMDPPPGLCRIKEPGQGIMEKIQDGAPYVPGQESF